MKKLLIANRGEIAVRIIRACRDLGITAVAIHSDADLTSLHAALADEAYGLGAGPAAATYLDIDKIIAIAKRAGVDAVHPGYGLLSERADFAEAVIAAGLVWVGPPPSAIRLLGDKIAARQLAREVNAPLAKGSNGPLADAAEAVAFAKTTGLPVAIKAAYGGGGRGIRVVRHLDDVADAFTSASREAMAAFGRGECYIEQFLERPRHIEAQVIADRFGNIAVLGTRDCTAQRRNQKLVEEAPAPFLSGDLENRITDAARRICAKAGYVGAGTVEFLLSQDGTLSFLEVNTRLQVEHPVTEEIFGIDLVAEQIRVACGEKLSLTHAVARGHAMEFRINAEDPGRGFLPTPGRITLFEPPTGPGIRLDSGVTAGSVVPELYDSLIAKLIITGRTRAEVIARAKRALREFRIEGIATTLPFHQAILEEQAFAGPDGLGIHTTWIETEFTAPKSMPRVSPVTDTLLRLPVEIDGKRHEIGLPAGLLSGLTMSAHPAPYQQPKLSDIIAPMACVLQKWLVADGAHVEEGDPVAVVEAMKTEMPLLAPTAGRLKHKAASGMGLSLGDIVAEVVF